METVLVVGLVGLGLLVALAVQGEQLRTRVHRLERDGAELSRTLATVQGWATQEFRALRGEFTVARVNASAEEVLERIEDRVRKRAASAASPVAPAPEEEKPDATRDTVATPPPSSPAPRLDDDEGEATSVFTPPLYARMTAMRPPAAPLSHPDLIGSEDIADEVARSHLGPEDTTPPRRGRVTRIAPAVHGPEQGGAA